jgi:hypothetical protein
MIQRQIAILRETYTTPSSQTASTHGTVAWLLRIEIDEMRCHIQTTPPPPPWCNSCQWARASSLSRLHDHTQTHHTTVGRNPLDEWSAQRTDLYLTTHNTHKRQTSMPPAWFEPAIPASQRPQTHALDRAATVICICITLHVVNKNKSMNSSRARVNILLAILCRLLNP